MAKPKKKAKKKLVEYVIYKKTIGVPWPGEWWDDTWAKSSKKDARAQIGREASETTYDEATFRLVKITYEEA